LDGQEQQVIPDSGMFTRFVESHHLALFYLQNIPRRERYN